MRWFVLLLVPMASASPLLTAVSPDAPGGEAVAITSPSAWDLSGWSLTDGEGTWEFPAGAWLGPGGEAWIVSDPAAWEAAGGAVASWSFDLRLADAGDDIALVDSAGRVMDAFAWGTGSHPDIRGAVSFTSESLIYRRAGPDTDSADDWRTPRTHRVGDTSWPAPVFDDARVTAYASPDTAFDVLLDLIETASSRLHLHVYELEHVHLARALAEAARRGVDVQVLLEDAPVGRWADQERVAAALVRELKAAGAAVFEAGNTRYAFHHLKVLLADDAVAVQSENWVPSGVPRDNMGNRGWGAVVHDTDFADWMGQVLAADRAAPETRPFASDAPVLVPWSEPPLRSDYLPRPSREFHYVTVTPVISPDHTADPARDPVVALVRHAQQSVWVQQMDLRLEAYNPLGWSAPDPMVDALLHAARTGLDVRVMAAAPFEEEDHGNREVLAALVAAGARVQEWHHPQLGILHNKGLLIDGHVVVLGSMNGNHHSRSNNREVGLILQGADVAAYYGQLFLDDWQGGRSNPGAVLQDVRALPATPLPILFVALLLFTACRCCRC